MISANEARAITKESAEYMKYLDMIERKIRKSARNGLVSTSVSLSNINNSIRNIIVQQLREDGYEVISYPIGNETILFIVGWS